MLFLGCLRGTIYFVACLAQAGGFKFRRSAFRCEEPKARFKSANLCNCGLRPESSFQQLAFNSAQTGHLDGTIHNERVALKLLFCYTLCVLHVFQDMR